MPVVTDKKYHLDGYLVKQLEYCKNAVKDDWDVWIVIDGIEGAGKSTFAQQIAYYLDPTFDIDRIAFNGREHEQNILHDTEPCQAYILDEAGDGMESVSSMSKFNRMLKRTSQKVRQYNLFNILCIPSFFDLAKYYAIHRSWCLINVDVEVNEEKKRLERGKFFFYSRRRRKLLYLKGKRELDYNVAKANFYGRFTSKWVVDEEEYKRRKGKVKAVDPIMLDAEFIRECLKRNMETFLIKQYVDSPDQVGIVRQRYLKSVADASK